MDKPRRRSLDGTRQFRIIPSRFPPVDILESLVSPDELAVLHAIESMTNDRLQAELGQLHLVAKEDWVTGPGATVVMAAFTHIGNPSRFSDGSYGVYYAALSEQTAIAETVFHSERRLRATAEAPIDIDMRVYIGQVTTSLEDLRPPRFAPLQQPSLDSWPLAQQFAAARRTAGADGFIYRSARDADGQCVAAFRPRAVTRPRQGKHLRYHWDGERIAHVYPIGPLRRL